LARLVERWQTSAIFQWNTGAPDSITAQNQLTNISFFPPGGTGTPVVTPEGVAVFGPFPTKFGNVHWKDGAPNGNYFPADMFVRVDDPPSGTRTSETSIQKLD